MSLCKCHFVSSEGDRRKQRGKVREKGFMSRDATPSFALLGGEKCSGSRGEAREGEENRQWGLMVSDVPGDSSKICVRCCSLRGNTQEGR